MVRRARERKLQKAIVNWMRAEHPKLRCVGSANGAFLGPGAAGAIRWAALESTGCSPGYPDLFVHRRGGNNEIGFAVEVKTDVGVLTRAQKAWRDDLIAEGCSFAVVRSLNEFKEQLAAYLGPPAPRGDARSRAISIRHVELAVRALVRADEARALRGR